MPALKTFITARGRNLFPVLLLIPFLVCGYAATSEPGKALQATILELRGLRYHAAALELVISLQDFRAGCGRSADKILLCPQVTPELLTQRINTLDQLILKGTTGMDPGKSWPPLKKRLEQAISISLKQSPRQSFEELTLSISSLKTLMRSFADTSTLILDPELSSYYLMNAAILIVPDGVMRTALLRGQSSVLHLKKTSYAFYAWSFQTQEDLRELARSVTIALQDPSLSSLGGRITPSLHALQEKADLLELADPASGSRNNFALLTDVISGYQAFHSSAASGLKVLLEKRQSDLQWKLGIVTAFLAAVYAAICALALALFQFLKKEKEASDAEKRHLDEILKNMMQAIILINVSGIILSANKWAQSTFGYSTEEMVGKNVSLLMPAPYQSRHDQYLQNYLKTGTKKIIGSGREVSGLRKDGSVFPMTLSITPTFGSAGAPEFIGVVTDITAQKEQECNILAAQEQAEKANASKSAFLANMSHELRTPMNGIIGLTGLLTESSLNAEQQKMSQAVLSSAHNLLVLLNDILDFSKIEAGELRLEATPFNLKEALQEIIHLLSPLAGEKGLALVNYYADAAPLMVMGDSLRLKQIATNLIGNALKFTHSGHVKLSVDAQQTGEKGHYLYRFIVEDTGIGIPPEAQKRLFKKFSQADISTNRQYGGTGLGLAISQELAALMGGCITLASEFGKGTSIQVTIPLQEASGEREVGYSRPLKIIPFSAEGLKGRRVLVVDDHPVNLMVMDKLLQKMGFTQIDLAKSGEEALGMVAKQGYNLVFMDCTMPQMDGFEACRRIRNNEANTGGKRTIIIAVTANAMATDRDACLNAGMDDYLSKPVDQHKLHALLGKWLSGDARNEDRFESPAAGNPGTGGNSSCPINLAQVEVFTDGDPEQEKILWDIFLQSNGPVLDILRQHVSGGNSEGVWKDAAHKLKGSAAQTGADRLSALCREAQEGSGQLSTVEKEALLEKIEGSFREVREFFEGRFGAGGGNRTRIASLEG